VVVGRLRVHFAPVDEFPSPPIQAKNRESEFQSRNRCLCVVRFREVVFLAGTEKRYAMPPPRKSPMYWAFWCWLVGDRASDDVLLGQASKQTEVDAESEIKGQEGGMDRVEGGKKGRKELGIW